MSFVVHFVTLFMLGLITYSAEKDAGGLHLIASTSDEGDAETSNPQPWVAPPDRHEGVSPQPTDSPSDAAPVDMPFESPQILISTEKPIGVETPNPEKPSQHAADITQPVGEPSGGGLEGRNPNARAAMAGRRGGSRQSEEAVERGLRWLVAHQREDGSWCFDLNKPPCNGLCRNPGTQASTTAATALALLPFLGAGYTHKQGEHQEAVRRGLYYLGTRARLTPNGVDLQDGTMYGQALSTIALCEAYAMTNDPALKDVAQQAVRFVVFAQDQSGGGWRYSPGQPGDVTVTGWQLMALKSAQLAKLNVPSPTAVLVRKFLDSVQTDHGARYNYMVAQPPRQTNVTTAVGLLCRMYTGWRRDNPALYQGVAYLHKWGPSENNIYYNYYATQVLHHWGGPEWRAWNERMRNYLVATQSNDSHEAGSWYFPDPYGDAGGRLYNTAMAVMTLEVYYRYAPLYGEEAVRDEF